MWGPVPTKQIAGHRVFVPHHVIAQRAVPTGESVSKSLIMNNSCSWDTNVYTRVIVYLRLPKELRPDLSGHSQSTLSCFGADTHSARFKGHGQGLTAH